MNIKVIASGSAGNCYRIDDSKTAMLLECGVPIKKIKEGCDFDLSNIFACFVTHEHGDHIKAARDIMKAGIDVYMSAGTAVAAEIDGHRMHFFNALSVDSRRLVEYEPLTIGTFTVVPFTIHHDALEPVGYIVSSTATGEKLLFMTDSAYTEYRFNGLTHIMIEANFSEETLGYDARRHRLRQSHMSVENCVEMLKANDLSTVREIWLLHLSEGNADAAEFKRQVQEATGKAVYIA